MMRKMDRRTIRHINSNAFMNIHCDIHPFIDIDIATIE